jgi:carboxylate-amine ligase
VPRPAYREVFDVLRGLGADELAERERARDAWASEHHLVFGVAGAEQPFPVDLVPRIISAHEWSELGAGLVQRARAIEHFLRDVYGEQRIVADRLLTPEVLSAVPGWWAQAERLPEGTVRAPVMGFDVVRNEYGGWRVLEDNVRDPSGAAYGIAARALVDAVMPDLPRPAGLVDPATAFERLRSTLLAHAKPGTRAALLSSGPGSSAWYEHTRLAQGAGLLLVGPDDLDVAGGRVVHRATGEPIGALYLRIDPELVDLVDSAGRGIGAALFDAAAAGGVVLANAPGNGVADDKAVYRSVPEFIGYYLGERPLLESVPTYLPRDPVEARAVLERVGELVTKPVDGHGGAGVLIGPVASAGDVVRRRAEIAADPGAWVAQELVSLSSLPSLHAGQLQPRHVDLRAFVHLTGVEAADASLVGVALTRVAPHGSLVVNSSRGGGAKDTWIVASPEEGAHVRTGG